MTNNNFIAIKLTFARISIIVLFLFCTFNIFLLNKQKEDIRKLKYEIYQKETTIKNVDNRVDDIEWRINDIESRVDDLERYRNYY